MLPWRSCSRDTHAAVTELMTRLWRSHHNLKILEHAWNNHKAHFDDSIFIYIWVAISRGEFAPKDESPFLKLMWTFKTTWWSEHVLSKQFETQLWRSEEDTKHCQIKVELIFLGSISCSVYLPAWHALNYIEERFLDYFGVEYLV